MPKKGIQGHIYCSKCKRSYDSNDFYDKHIEHNQSTYKSTQTEEMHTHKYVSHISNNNIIVTCETCGDVKVVKQWTAISDKLYEKQNKKRVRFGKK